MLQRTAVRPRPIQCSCSSLSHFYSQYVFILSLVRRSRLAAAKKFDWCFVYTHILAVHVARFLSIPPSPCVSFPRVVLCQSLMCLCCFDSFQMVFGILVLPATRAISHIYSLMWTKQIHYSLRLRWNLMVEMKFSPLQIRIVNVLFIISFVSSFSPLRLCWVRCSR